MKEEELIKNIRNFSTQSVIERLENNLKVLKTYVDTPRLISRLEYYDANSRDWFHSVENKIESYQLIRIKPMKCRKFNIEDSCIIAGNRNIQNKYGELYNINSYKYCLKTRKLLFEISLANEANYIAINSEELLKNYLKLDGTPLGVEI